MEKLAREELFEKLKIAVAQFEYHVEKSDIALFTEGEMKILADVKLTINRIIDKEWIAGKQPLKTEEE